MISPIILTDFHKMWYECAIRDTPVLLYFQNPKFPIIDNTNLVEEQTSEVRATLAACNPGCGMMYGSRSWKNMQRLLR
jgi:hypothetical protein